ncbi:MAG: hypothetical protein DRI39_10040 [Chloroflexi bacterium]|nr:MAG: hypothetical protein DRI39_10040 [Chloroflexota bacterium]RLC95846.1 MAG: hypothetical protein DRI40_04815 [Chloroflexota bacterium]
MASIGKVTLPPVSQVCIVVRDIEKAADYYTSTFGIGPFSIDEINMEGPILRGKPITLHIKVGFAQSGPLQVELIQPVEGENLYTEFLATHGEGLHHLGFEVDDLKGILAELATEGIEPIFHHDLGFYAYAYLNSDKVGGVIFELLWSRK